MAVFKLFSVLTSLVLLTSCSTPPPPAAPVEEKKVNPKLAELPQKIEAIVKAEKLSGVQVYILDRQEVPLKFVSGHAVKDPKTPFTEDSRVALGPAAKTMTAMLIGQLIDLKLIDWNTPLKNVIPKDLVGMNAELGNITIEMLLAHRSGLIDAKKLKVWPTLLDSKLTSRRARELLVKSILSYDPQFPPNSKTSLSDSGYIVLGFIAEQLTNFPWEELVKNKIASPLGMNTCSFDPSGEPRAFAPAGILQCSGNDWAKFLKEVNLGFFQESFLLREQTFQKLLSFTAEPPFTHSGFLRYEKIWAGGPTLTILGAHKDGTSMAALAPRRELSLVVATNTGGKDGQEGAAKILKLLTEAVQ